MKSRHKKHLQRIIKRSPIVSFSIENLFKKNQYLTKEELSTFNESIGMDMEYVYSKKYKCIKKEMFTNVILFVDNYLVCGGHHFIYLLIPQPDGTYYLTEKENVSEWVKAYWDKVDPHNKRKWMFIDEDVNDLFDYMLGKFEKHLR